MYICNITFLTDARALSKTLDYLRGTFIPAISADGTQPILAIVREMQGQPVREFDPLSITVQAKFSDRDAAKKWESETAEPALKAYTILFGQNALTFSTLIEQLPLID